MQRQLIRGGTVIDGTGSARRRADIVVTDGRIETIAPPGQIGFGAGADVDAADVLDATGLVVAPGFIDIHTHYDAQVFWDPWLTPSCFHGVTTVVTGNCGFAFAPVKADQVEALCRMMKHVEDMDPATLLAGVPWDWETFPEYLDSVERHGSALNVACYAGLNPLRFFVMGDASITDEASPAQIEEMRRHVRISLEAGAAGFGGSSAPTHSMDGGRPIPSRRTDPAEMLALLRVLHEVGHGVGHFNPGERIKHDDIYEIAAAIPDVPLTWTALLALDGYPQFHRGLLAKNRAAREAGLQVWPQVSPRPLSFSMTLKDPFNLNMRAPWGALMGVRVDERVAMYRDEAWRERARADADGAGGFPLRWDKYVVIETGRPELVGRTIAELAVEEGRHPVDTIVDLALAEGLELRVKAALANDDPAGIAELLPDDTCLIGLADSGAHVGMLCDSVFSSDLLGQWVREKQVMSLEQAVHKLTGEPAAVFGFADRGILAEGRAADVCVFDPDTIAPGPIRRVRDFPANGERLTADAPEGVVHVLVNGTPIRRDGRSLPEALDAKPGRLLRSGH